MSRIEGLCALQSVDVVTTRSVLIYVQNKDAAFSEFYRVLRPGGRMSIFEPINNYFPDDKRSVPGGDLVRWSTLALQEGTSPVLVVFRLGHASTAMIERHYGELVEGFDREIADRLAEARRRERRSPDLAPVSSLVAARRSRRRNPRKRTR